MGDDTSEPVAPSEATGSGVPWDLLRKKSIQPGGFGEERIRLWPLLLQVDTAATLPDPEEPSVPQDEVEQNEDVAESEASANQSVHRDERQIGLDTDRSFVLYPVDDQRNRDSLKAQLHRLIVAVFRKRPHLNYFQGYHDIVSVIFLTIPRELQLVSVEKLSLHRLRDSMGASLEPVVGLLRVLQRLLQAVDTDFASLLERTAPLPYFALSNLLTLLSHDVPTLPLIQHIFDYLFSRHPVAVVYLVAAVALTRREQAFQLEREGEDGFIHSVLSSLPELYEEDEHELPGEVVNLENEIAADTKPSASQECAPHEKETEILAPGDDIVEEALLTEGETEQSSSVGNEPEAPRSCSPASHSLIEEDTESAEAPTVVSTASASLSSLSYAETETTTDTDTESEVKEISEKSHRSRSPSPSHFEHVPPRPRISLTALLTHADELYVRYPPSHPSIALSTVMGPQSVMLTWSEDPTELPADDDAELMVTKPELVALPHIEPEDEVASDDESAYASKGHRRHAREERERRKRRKLRKPRHLVIERKTMVAGAVLVLSVAMAVYGFQNGGPAGLFREGSQQRHSVGKEWKRMSRFVGGMLLGIGERVVDGLFN